MRKQEDPTSKDLKARVKALATHYKTSARVYRSKKDRNVWYVAWGSTKAFRFGGEGLRKSGFQVKTFETRDAEKERNTTTVRLGSVTADLAFWRSLGAVADLAGDPESLTRTVSYGLGEERRSALSALIERRGRGRVVRVKGKGKVGALVNAANGAQESLTNGLSTIQGALDQVVKAARELGKDDIVRAIQSELSDIEQAEEALRSVLAKLDTPSAVGESEEDPGVPARDGRGAGRGSGRPLGKSRRGQLRRMVKDGEGPHGAGQGPRARDRERRSAACGKG